MRPGIPPGMQKPCRWWIVAQSQIAAETGTAHGPLLQPKEKAWACCQRKTLAEVGWPALVLFPKCFELRPMQDPDHRPYCPSTDVVHQNKSLQPCDAQLGANKNRRNISMLAPQRKEADLGDIPRVHTHTAAYK